MPHLQTALLHIQDQRVVQVQCCAAIEAMSKKHLAFGALPGCRPLDGSPEISDAGYQAGQPRIAYGNLNNAYAFVLRMRA